jgi:hypothetical protein
MIVLGDRILVGRLEKEGHRTTVPVRHAKEISQKAWRSFREKFPGRQSLFFGHNVVALFGRYGAWNAFEWQTWEDLGSRIDPGLTGAVRLDHKGLRPLDLNVEDPVVLHGSWGVLADEDDFTSGTRLPQDVERLYRLDRQLEALGITRHPFAVRRSGFERLLADSKRKIKGWELVAA